MLADIPRASEGPVRVVGVVDHGHICLAILEDILQRLIFRIGTQSKKLITEPDERGHTAVAVIQQRISVAVQHWQELDATGHCLCPLSPFEHVLQLVDALLTYRSPPAVLWIQADFLQLDGYGPEGRWLQCHLGWGLGAGESREDR